MLNHIALGLLIFVAITLFYGIIAIHDIPYEIAKERKHPHQDAIHVAGWVSLFTLHVIWPFLWIWATLYREDRGWGFQTDKPQDSRIDALERKLGQIQRQLKSQTKSNRHSHKRMRHTGDAPAETPKQTPKKPESVDLQHTKPSQGES